MRSGTLAFLATLAAGLVALLAFGLLERRDEAFTLGVVPAVTLEAAPGQWICQGPIDVPEEFDAVELTLAAQGAGAVVEVREAPGSRRLASGTGRSAEGGAFTAELDRAVPAGQRVEVCVRGEAGAVAVMGNDAPASRSSAAYRGGEELPADLAIVFTRDDRSLLSMTGDIVERAGLFHGGWIGGWTIALLGVLVLTAVPGLLFLALRDALGDDQRPARNSRS